MFLMQMERLLERSAQGRQKLEFQLQRQAARKQSAEAVR
jgi:hypothetical protein